MVIKMPLPSELLRQIVDPAGGRVSLVTGAGCSKEEPTSLPLASECSQDAHRRLRADNVLKADCGDPNDLSCVADDVFAATNGQSALVTRLPVSPFRNATPNDGHMLAAVLLLEGSVGAVLTLNFDMAFSVALANIGVVNEVSTVVGPEDHDKVGSFNLVYLHRNAFSDPEQWILRTESLENDWHDAWEEVLTTRLLSTPVTVFAGLGTPAKVLLETARRIKGCLPENAATAIQVDPSPRVESVFADALEIAEDSYLQMGWVDFMRNLAARVLEEQTASIQSACEDVQTAEGYPTEDTLRTCRSIASKGLVHVGTIRARWTLHRKPYRPSKHIDDKLLAHLILAIAMIEREKDCTARFRENGTVEFVKGGNTVAAILVASGKGVCGWYVMETQLIESRKYWRGGQFDPRVALVAGIQGGRPVNASPPADIVVGDENESIAGIGGGIRMISTDELRQDGFALDSLLGGV